MRRASILVVGVLALVVFAAAARGEEASVLLEAGVYAQDVAGDLDKAIETYQKIVADDAANRRTVAEDPAGSARIRSACPRATECRSRPCTARPSRTADALC